MELGVVVNDRVSPRGSRSQRGVIGVDWEVSGVEEGIICICPQVTPPLGNKHEEDETQRNITLHVCYTSMHRQI